jgi:hypothetical protein
VISSIVPVSGPLAGSTRVTLVGIRLGSGDVSTVRFGTSPSPAITWLTSTLVVVTTPSVASSGSVSVLLTSTAFGTATSGQSFTFNPAPVFSSVTPSSGPNEGGITVSLTGTNLGANDVTSVSLCGTPAASVTFVSAALVHVVAGPRTDTLACGPGATVLVSTSFGSATLAASFQYLVRA